MSRDLPWCYAPINGAVMAWMLLGHLSNCMKTLDEGAEHLLPHQIAEIDGRFTME